MRCACMYPSFVDPQSAVAHSQLPAPRYAPVTAAPSLAVFRQHLKTFCSHAHTLTLSLNL